MKTFFYKGYFVMLERQQNGSIRAVADNDNDRFGEVFYFYSLTQAIKKMKQDCTYRLKSGLNG